MAQTFVYLDRSVIRKKWKFNRGPLGRAGAWLMRTARKSIRRRKNRNIHSPVGTPPYSHKPGALPPFKQIFFQPNNFNMTVTVGMVGYPGKGKPVPGLHEHGRHATRKIFKAVGRRQLKRKFKVPRMGGIVTKRVAQGVQYPPRPFMHPALLKIIPQLPKFWTNSLR